MSTLPVVEEVLRETEVPMSVRQIVEYAGPRLPTRSKTPDTVVARDLSMDIKRKGDGSAFVRTAPGRYTLREIHLRQQDAGAGAAPAADAVTAEQAGDEAARAWTPPGNGLAPTPVLSSALRDDRAATLPARKPEARSSEGHKTAG